MIAPGWTALTAIPSSAQRRAASTAKRTLAAASPLLDGVTGIYLEDCNEAEQVSKAPEGAGGGVAPYALDPANAKRLWDLSLSLIA